MFSRKTYESRREVLASSMGSGILLFLGNDEQGLNYADNSFRYRQDSTFLYYFGISRPGLAAVMDIDAGRTVLFGDELSLDTIVWTGPKQSVRCGAEQVGVSDVRPLGDLQNYVEDAVSKGRTVHYLPQYRPENKLWIMRLLGVDPSVQEGSVPFIRAVVAQRNHKSAEEVAEIEKACLVTADMHETAMRIVRPGMRECEVVAEVEAVARRAGCELSFPTIGSIRGETLHNHAYGNVIGEQDMFLLDAGAEVESGYCGDMSSTIPSGKHFTPIQRTVYEIQTAMHAAAVAELRPGVPFVSVYEKASLVMIEAMKGLGLMRGDSQEALHEGAHAMFFQCGLGHMMGLDVHDMENLGEVWVGYGGKPKSTQFGRKSLRLAVPLEPGFVLTIEPGVYFIPQLMDMWQAEGRCADFINYDRLSEFRGFGGIRNEEDYLITEDGARLLGRRIPLEPDEVEALR